MNITALTAKALDLNKIKEISDKPVFETLSDFKKLEKNNREWLEYGLAVCRRACIEGLSITPYDEQLLAAKYLFDGKIVEMATGEGKTVSAVFAAFLNISLGRRTHILTFNDYLAKRDYNWMKPIYNILGISVSYITEETAADERRKRYMSDVIYTTARESGFDYLRDFIVFDEKEIVHYGLCCAIVDEADSILIDEARIPLAIAGEIPIKENDELPEIYSFVSSLPQEAYGFSNEDKGVYLTDYGVSEAEKYFNIENLYDAENNKLLSAVNDCLRAAFFLKENKDYIVKNDEIQIVDEFTGRTVKNRHYPGTLHSAVETKHGLKTSYKGVTMGTVPLQFFIRQYEYISGMTGTAEASAEEFELLYGLKLEKVPLHIPSRRIDYPIQIYYNQKIKFEKITETIISAHKKGQPVLAGTDSITESEELARVLKENGISGISVLNAKNNEMEAEILKNAGDFGAVTISTNMAGRGVDILLGGKEQKNLEKVIEAGGLLVICTRLNESSRINNQLRGRCGRQGDRGESRVFCALDDDIMVKYGLKKLIPAARYPDYTTEQITEKSVVREVGRIQKISEGYTLDERKRLLKFTMISEKHREAIFNTRIKYLKGELIPEFWQNGNLEGYEKAVKIFGQEKTETLQRECVISVINDAWIEYLDFTSELREGIHLTSVGGKNPSEEFNIESEKFYCGMEEYVYGRMLEQLDIIISTDSTEITIKKPKDIWTFLLDESGDELVKKPFLINAVTEHGGFEENGGESKDDKKEKGFFSAFSGLFGKKKQ